MAFPAKQFPCATPLLQATRKDTWQRLSDTCPPHADRLLTGSCPEQKGGGVTVFAGEPEKEKNRTCKGRCVGY